MKRWRELMDAPLLDGPEDGRSVSEQAAGRAPERANGHRVRGRKRPRDVIELCFDAVTTVGWPLLFELPAHRWGWQPRQDFAWLGFNLTALTFEQMADQLGLSGATVGQDFRIARFSGWIERRIEEAEWVQREFGGGLLWLPIS